MKISKKKKIVILTVLLSFFLFFALMAVTFLVIEKHSNPSEDKNQVGEFDEFVLQSTDFTTMSDELAFQSARYVMYKKSDYLGKYFTIRGEVCFLQANDGGLQYLVLTLNGGTYEKDGITYTRSIEVLFELNGSYRIPYKEFIDEFTDSYGRYLTISGFMDIEKINDQEILYIRNTKIVQ